MRLDKYITRTRILDLEAQTVSGALDELLRVALFRSGREALDREQMLRDLLARERTMTTYLGNRVAMPHLRLPLEKPLVFAIGRCAKGLVDDQLPEYREVRLVVLLLANADEPNYLNALASLARLLREPLLVDRLVESSSLREFQERVLMGFGGLAAKPLRAQSKSNRLFLRQAGAIAKAAEASAILFFTDTFAGGFEPDASFPNHRTILVSHAPNDRHAGKPPFVAALTVRALGRQRLSQLRSAVLIGLTRGHIRYNDRLLCVGGLPNSNEIDTLVLVDVEKEFRNVLARQNEMVPSAVDIEVIERILAIASELAVEGREGKPVGCLFVLGDTAKVSGMSKPLVLNPFHGYKAEERNILNPFMDETIKEFSQIDGAFLIEGDGTIASAGALLHPAAEYYRDLPGGFGSRHSAAAAVSRAADCVAITVSASTGQVTLFRHGVMLPLIEKSGSLTL